MRIFVKQRSRNLYKAELDVIIGQETVGRIFVKGSMWTPKSKVYVEINERTFYLHAKRSAAKRGLEDWWPYAIELDGEGREIGEIFQAFDKVGNYGYQYAEINYAEYKMYPIGYGEEGAKNPVYMGDMQVALVSKPAVIYDDMYEFDIVVRDEQYIEAAVIFTAYVYTSAFFKPGTVMKKGWKKTITVTEKENLLSKFDVRFEETYG